MMGHLFNPGRREVITIKRTPIAGVGLSEGMELDIRLYKGRLYVGGYHVNVVRYNDRDGTVGLLTEQGETFVPQSSLEGLRNQRTEPKPPQPKEAGEKVKLIPYEQVPGAELQVEMPRPQTPYFATAEADHKLQIFGAFRRGDEWLLKVKYEVDGIPTEADAPLLRTRTGELLTSIRVYTMEQGIKQWRDVYLS